MNVVPLDPHATPETVLNLANEITEILAAGQITALAFIAIERDSTFHTGWSDAHAAPVLGALARLSHRINARMDEA
jgi:hypothetical protein